MVDMSTPHLGEYVRSNELPPWERFPVTILFAGLEQVGQDQKLEPVITLARASDGAPWPRRVILNKGNNGALIAAYGKDGAAWVKQPATIWNDPTVTYKGEVTGGLKVVPGHHLVQAAAAGAIPLPGPTPQPVAPGSAPGGNGAATPGYDPTGATMNMGGQTVPIPTGPLPAAMSNQGPSQGKTNYAGPGSDLDDALPL